MMAVGGLNNSVFLQTIMYVMNQSILQEESSYNYYYMQIGQETNASKCYGIYGCFQLSPPWTSKHRPVSLFPDELSKIDPTYILYTRSSLNQPEIFDLNDFNYIEASSLSPRKPIYVISHGYIESGGIWWIRDTATRLLEFEDCNVIVVDWQKGSVPPYTQAVANIRLIGAITAHVLNDISTKTGDLKLNHVHCIGHSLGAHLCGYVGYTLQSEFGLKINRITGLDPAEPHFANANAPVRLDRSAANYVDVIHTDGSQFIRGGLGMTESIGHVDYYPNGGTDQPGCTKGVFQFIKDESGSAFNGVKKYLICNHARSYKIFYESIIPRCTFLSISCSSYEDFLAGKCWDCGRRGENCVKFGFHGKKHFEKLHGKKRKNASQVQYLITGDREPYCKGHYRITVQVSDSEKSVIHKGEIGQLMFTMHSTTDGSGSKSTPIGFVNGYHAPGKNFMGVVATDEIKSLKAVEIEWKYYSSLLNPLTWRLLSIPKIYLKKVTVESLELQDKIVVCPKGQGALVNGIPQIMIPSYC